MQYFGDHHYHQILFILIIINCPTWAQEIPKQKGSRRPWCENEINILKMVRLVQEV